MYLASASHRFGARLPIAFSSHCFFQLPSPSFSTHLTNRFATYSKSESSFQTWALIRTQLQTFVCVSRGVTNTKSRK